MNLRKTILMKNGLLLMLLGLAVLVIYLYFFIGIGETAKAIQQTNLFYYSLAITALFLSTAFYSMAWQSILRILEVRVPFLKTISFAFAGSFVDFVVPVQSFGGEISKVYLMSKKTGEDTGKIAASVIGHRILTMATTLIGIVIGSTLLFLGYKTSQMIMSLTLLVMASTAVSLSFILYLSMSPNATQRIAQWAVKFVSFISRGRWELTGFKAGLTKALETFHQGMQVLKKQPRNLVLPFLFSMTAFFLDLLVSYLVFVSLGSVVSINLLLVVFTIISAMQSIPLGITGEVAITEVAMIGIYTMLGIPAVVSAASTILTRALNVWVRVLIGFIVIQLMGMAFLLGGKPKKISEKTV